MSTQTKPSIVSAHGIWADGSCFSELIPALQAGRTRWRPRSTASTHPKATSPHFSARQGGSAARPSSSVTPTAEASSPPREPMTASPGGLHRRARPRRDRDVTEPAGPVPRHRRLLPHRSRRRARLDAAVSHPVLRGDCPSRSRGWSGRPTSRRPQTCSVVTLRAPRGGRSRAGTSWPATTAPSTPGCSASWRSAWAPPPMRFTVATSRCSPSPAW